MSTRIVRKTDLNTDTVTDTINHQGAGSLGMTRAMNTGVKEGGAHTMAMEMITGDGILMSTGIILGRLWAGIEILPRMGQHHHRPMS